MCRWSATRKRQGSKPSKSGLHTGVKRLQGREALGRLWGGIRGQQQEVQGQQKPEKEARRAEGQEGEAGKVAED